MIENLTDTELDRLKATTNEAEWNRTCDDIKSARGGEYPPDWWPRIMLSGLMPAITASWK